MPRKFAIPLIIILISGLSILYYFLGSQELITLPTPSKKIEISEPKICLRRGGKKAWEFSAEVGWTSPDENQVI